jgi:hypothetical protein
MWRTWKVNKVIRVVGAGPKKIFEQKGPFKYLNRPIHAFVKKLLHHVASVESTSQKKKVKQLLQKVCIHYKANFNGDFIKFY